MPDLHEVFTPMGYAPHAYVARAAAGELRAALAAGARLVVLHGPPNAGKTTLTVRTLESLGRVHDVVLCRPSSTAEDLVAGPGGSVTVLEDAHKLPEAVRFGVQAHLATRQETTVVALATRPFPTAPVTAAVQIAVPPMTSAELDAMLALGARAMGLDLPAGMRVAVIAHTGGEPSLCHLFAQHLCLEAGALTAGPGPVLVTGAAFERARERTPVALPP